MNCRTARLAEATEGKAIKRAEMGGDRLVGGVEEVAFPLPRLRAGKNQIGYSLDWGGSSPNDWCDLVNDGAVPALLLLSSTVTRHCALRPHNLEQKFHPNYLCNSRTVCIQVF